MKYIEFKNTSATTINNFITINGFFAFTEQQLNEGLKKLNAEKKDIFRFGSGGFMLKTKKDEFRAIRNNINLELENNLENDAFLKDALTYELNNHEGDLEDALDALNITEKYINDTEFYNRVHSLDINNLIR